MATKGGIRQILIDELEENERDMVGLSFVFFDEHGNLDYTYNDETDLTEGELKEKAVEAARQSADENAQWVFCLEDGKVTNWIEL